MNALYHFANEISRGKHKIVVIANFVVVGIVDSMSKFNMNIIYYNYLAKN